MRSPPALPHTMNDHAAAQYAEIQRQHELLRQDIARLRAAVSGPGHAASEAALAQSLAEEVTRLHEAVRRHFALEEKGGYLEPVIAARPGVSRAVQRLRQQHSTILEALSRLQSGLQTGIPPARARAEALSILDLLGSHEAEETDLIQRVLTEDIGTGD